MKVLILSKYENEGGAAVAALRNYQALNSIGVSTQMLVHKKQSDDPSILAPSSKYQKLKEAISHHIDQLPNYFYQDRSDYLFTPAWYSSGDILKEIKSIQPDLVHIHWASKGMISLKDIEKISVPVIFTLHDSWLFTGGCHIPFECIKFHKECFRCPTLSSNFRKDLSYKIFRNKKKLFNKKSDLYFIAVSEWMQLSARRSALLEQKNIYKIPNPINTDEFRPLNKKTAKSQLNIPINKKVILFGALSATSDKNKGFDKLIKAINEMTFTDCQILVFGSSGAKLPQMKKYKIDNVGRLYDTLSLRLVYSAADVMVVPSEMESFGQTASEAMSCGTPVVAFNTSGLKDIVDHKKNGYLAQAFDAKDLARGIEWVLFNTNAKDLCSNARKKVLDKFEMNKIGKDLKKVYAEILGGTIIDADTNSAIKKTKEI